MHQLVASPVSSIVCAVLYLRFAARTLYINGTKNNVEKVATDNPPITARPIAAFCPVPSDIGIMPRIIAMAVIHTGLKRWKPAAEAASIELFPALNCSLQNVTIKILFADATPIVITAPMSAGTLNVD